MIKNDKSTSQNIYLSHFPENQNDEEIDNQSYSELMKANSSEPSLLKTRSINDEYNSEELKFDIDSEKLISRTKRQLSISSQTNTNHQGDSKSIKLDELTGEPMELDNNTKNQEQQQSQIQIPPK